MKGWLLWVCWLIFSGSEWLWEPCQSKASVIYHLHTKKDLQKFVLTGLQRRNGIHDSQLQPGRYTVTWGLVLLSIVAYTNKNGQLVVNMSVLTMFRLNNDSPVWQP